MILEVDEKTRQRFWHLAAIASDESCWSWNGSVVSGSPRFNPYKSGLSPQAIRTAYILTFGEIPKGKRVRHTCSNSLCVNPKHLVLSSELEDRFCSKVDKSPGFGLNGDCWEWRGHITQAGYGWFALSHRKGIAAHRFALQLATGIEQPEEIFACHHCNNRKCCRPSHLFWGTATDNQRDMTNKGRHRWGEKNGQAKLTEEQVIEIKELLSDGQYSQQEIGNMFGVCQSAISAIKLGKSWNPTELTPRRLRKY